MDSFASEQLTGKELDVLIHRIESVARVMDAYWEIPYLRCRLGVDALLGLIPGIGDGLACVPFAYFMYVGKTHEMPLLDMLRMTKNQLIDVAVGSIPMVGDLVDVVYRSNTMNAALLVAHLKQKYGYLDVGEGEPIDVEEVTL